jgi:hypothetical protein
MSVKLETRGWHVDSGATAHMSPHIDWLQDTRNAPANISFANGEETSVNTVGNVKVTLTDSSKMKINDVVHIPNLSTNLISVSKTAQKGLIWVFKADGAHMYSERNFHVKGEIIASAKQVDGLYRLDLQEDYGDKPKKKHQEQVNLTVWDTWHKRLGHLGQANMELLKSG